MLVVIIKENIVVSDATKELKTWCKANLEVSNPEYAKKQRMGFWTGNTPSKLTYYKEIGDDLVLPYGVKDEIPVKDTDIIVNRFISKEDVGYRDCEVPLYDYQDKAVENMIAKGYGILQAPAGSGKTQMGIAMAIRHNKPTLWICHTKDLLNQSKSRALQYIPEEYIGTITEGKINVGKGITFATVQTLAKVDLSHLYDLWDVVIVDECHRVAGSPTNITQYFKVLDNIAAPHKYGLSATVHRADGLLTGLYSLLGKVTHVVTDKEVADKIVPVRVIAKGTDTKLSRECLNTDGTLCYSKFINYLCEDTERTELIVQDIINNKGKSCLILSDRLNHLAEMMDSLPLDMTADAVMISGKMTSRKGKEEREEALADMRNGNKKYLFATYSLCKEGLDIPRLERLFMTTPVKDYAVVAQSIGRVARKFDSKDEPIAYDYVDNIQYAARAYKDRVKTYKKIGCVL